MHLSSLLVAVLLPLALSKPTPRKKPGSFTVHLARRSEAEYARDGPTDLQRAYAKYGIPSTQGMDGYRPEPISRFQGNSKIAGGAPGAKDDGKDEKGEVENNPTSHDIQFLSPVTIGGQPFIMNFDTGSSDTWVMNTDMDDEEAKKDHHLYDPRKSKTYSKLDGLTFSIKYGDKSHASGPVITDVMDIGGATVRKQAIGLPTKVAASLANDKSSDGLVGLAMNKLNTVRPDKQKTFFENLAEDLDEPVFTAQLRKGKMGSYEFGAIDKTKYAGDLVNVPVNNKNGFWEISSALYSVGQLDKIQKVENGTGTAILDTGTTLLILDEEVVKAYYAQVKGARYDASRYAGWVYPCNASMPSLFLAVGHDHMAIIPSSLLTFQNYGPGPDGTDVCYGGLQSNNAGGIQILGDVFFKALFVVFDYRGPSVSLAPHA
ncbi:putative aspergillopepsin I [Microsporum canis]|uniref:Putative aspergillopepsin A-like aspartic endopeptidase MCYG_07979 n=1 Tax=Arthroderma otae (strain ATCC MYA-4605 / CBS 113480) TaxID=554155 RepID=Y7979_ARTOC|nr:aspartyl protease 3 [Microsporum canis CBS 113480]C5FZ57.1 RecName: Full=Putative aspergillopepsin A-like aspartic endopeptidase MCYG_07979; Flags: Precursor [Microsporum canis CBS 113480]EEQ35160.1 aspartyl protease 3 [Microsporum canis CBS 113480]